MLSFWYLKDDTQLYDRRVKGALTYISDIGADNLKPAFVLCTLFAQALFWQGLIRQRQARWDCLENQVTQVIFNSFMLTFAFIGGAGCICLTVFDLFDFQKVHHFSLYCFIGGYLFHALFTTIELYQHTKLRWFSCCVGRDPKSKWRNFCGGRNHEGV